MNHGVITDDTQFDALLKQTHVDDVWESDVHGKKKLSLLQIHTAHDLKYAPNDIVRKRLNVLAERVILELGEWLVIKKKSSQRKVLCVHEVFHKRYVTICL